jgi:hypothetical protein
MVLQVATGFFYQGGTVVLLIRGTMMRSIEPSVSRRRMFLGMYVYSCTFSKFALQWGKRAE